MRKWVNIYRSKIAEFEALAAWADGYRNAGVADCARLAAKKLRDEIEAFEKTGQKPEPPIVIHHG